MCVLALGRASAAHPASPLHLASAPSQRPRPRPVHAPVRPRGLTRRAQEQIRETGDADGALELRAVELLRASGLRGFGTGRLTPKRDYTLAEMRLNKVEPGAFLSPRDTTLEGVRTQAAAAFAAGTLAFVAATHPSSAQLLAGSVGALTLLMVDQVGNGGAAEALVLDSLGRATSAAYRKRVARHESGHFLVAWLCGILPRAYTLSAWDALQREGALNVQAGAQFADKAFQSEVAGGKMSSASLDVFCCIALAGIASEVIAFGQAEGVLACCCLLHRTGLTHAPRQAASTTSGSLMACCRRWPLRRSEPTRKCAGLRWPPRRCSDATPPRTTLWRRLWYPAPASARASACLSDT